MDRIEMKIVGMHCNACVTAIQTVTEALEGVDSAYVDLAGSKAVFEIDIEKISGEDIIKEIMDLGYHIEMDTDASG